MKKRMQARINGYDGMGVEVDEETESGAWWTSTEGEDPGTLCYVDSDGSVHEGSMMWQTIGIRPAIWLKLNK